MSFQINLVSLLNGLTTCFLLIYLVVCAYVSGLDLYLLFFFNKIQLFTPLKGPTMHHSFKGPCSIVFLTRPSHTFPLIGLAIQVARLVTCPFLVDLICISQTNLTSLLSRLATCYFYWISCVSLPLLTSLVSFFIVLSTCPYIGLVVHPPLKVIFLIINYDYPKALLCLHV